MAANEELRYSIFVVLLDEYVGTIPQMRRRTPSVTDQSHSFSWD